jgi:hypothetical protein
MSHSAMRVSLWAVVEGTEVEVVQFTTSYDMNQIPSATAVLPVGRRVTTLEPAEAHRLAGEIKIQLPVQVFARIEHTSGFKDDRAIVPEGDYMVFDGFVTGMGYKRGTNKLQMALSMTHWLSGLSFSSALSASSHPNNPTHFTFNPGLRLAGDGAGAGAAISKHFVARTLAQTRITQTAVQEDLWGKGILPWFKDLTKSDHLAQEVFDLNDGVNSEAAAALARFEGDKLPMGELADAAVAADAIANDIAVSVFTPGNTNHYGALAHTTLWDKLVGDLAPTYVFSVIPFPDKALVVPFVPGLREYWNPRDESHSMMARDLDFINISARLPRALRAMGLFGGHGSRAGANLAPNDPANEKTIGGMYVGREDGMVMFKQAPRWLSQFMGPAIYSKKAAGAGGKPKGGAIDPRAGDKPDGADPKEVKERAKKLLNKMAHALYANEVLKGRHGSVSGALRFDICPGSTIKMEGVSEKFIGEKDAIGDTRFATVLRVTQYFDAETPRTGTAFHLAHIRNEQENEDDDTSLDQHPLYERKWTGDYLTTRE